MLRHLTTAALAAAILLTPSILADDFHPIPNSTKYRDSAPAAKGSAGATTVTVQALLNRDLTTDVEIAAEGGSIENVKLTAGGTTTNYNHENGVFSISGLTGLLRGDTVEIKAHITGASPGTDIIRVTDTVKMRPNLTFVAVGGQRHALAGMPVNVHAVVQEMNGDLGARCNCVLYDGTTEIDRADGIWVDANSSVTCAFAPVLETPGEKDFWFRIENVVPGDYDLTDNQVHLSVTIHSPEEEFEQWTAEANDETYESYYRARMSELESEQRRSGWRTSASFTATQRELIPGTNATISYRLATDGNTLIEFNDVPLTGWTHQIGRPCGRATVGATRASLCSFIRPVGATITTITVGTSSGDVTYYSIQWVRTYDPETGTYDYYTLNESSGQETEGIQQRFGSTVDMTVNVRSGDRSLFAQPFLNLVGYETHIGWNTCTTPETSYCEIWRYDATGKKGTETGGITH
ncbi:MAG TPA: hypothetical protein VEK57_24520 [Thermoanaerobaculia bacterium]|nr:hypothetical protein [Thermoanaerobaculia bacterium]